MTGLNWDLSEQATPFGPIKCFSVKWKGFQNIFSILYVGLRFSPSFSNNNTTHTIFPAVDFLIAITPSFLTVCSLCNNFLKTELATSCQFIHLRNGNEEEEVGKQQLYFGKFPKDNSSRLLSLSLNYHQWSKRELTQFFAEHLIA